MSQQACQHFAPLAGEGRVGPSRLTDRDSLDFKMNDWFDALGRRFTDAAREQGAEIPPPELDAQLADEILELARVAAHSKERRFAPLACFMAGVALERLRQAQATSPIGEAAYIRSVSRSLEAETPTEVSSTTS
jgi:hypothetical protein